MALNTSLNGKNVVITGGAAGIGLEIAKSYLKRGVKHLAILDLNPEAGKQTVSELQREFGNEKVIFLKADVCDKNDLDSTFEELIKRWKQIDVLVNNAGIARDSAPEKVLAINLTALVTWTLKYWNYMRKDKGGKGGTIVNIASIYGFTTDPYIPVYTATKHGVMGFTKSLGHKFNYDRTGVRVIALCPGYTYTSLTTVNKMCFQEPDLIKEYEKYFEKDAVFQEPEVVGAAAADMFEKVESGTAWCIIGGKPIYEV